MASLGLTIPVPEVIDPALWRERYVFGHQLGLELKFAAGIHADAIEAAMIDLAGRLPEHVIAWHLRCSLGELGNKLGVSFERLVVKSEPLDDGLRAGIDYDVVQQRIPLTRHSVENNYRIELCESILSVERVRLYIGDNLVFTVHNPSTGAASIRIHDQRNGVLYIVGQADATMQMGAWGNASGALPLGNRGFANAMYSTLVTGIQPRGSIPGAWSVDYVKGPISHEGIPNRIDVALANWVALNAGRLMLGISGGSQAGGLGSSSVSIDGVSQNAAVSQSAMYGLNAPMETAFEAITKLIDWNMYRRRLRGIHVGGL